MLKSFEGCLSLWPAFGLSNSNSSTLASTVWLCDMLKELNLQCFQNLSFLFRTGFSQSFPKAIEIPEAVFWVFNKTSFMVKFPNECKTSFLDVLFPVSSQETCKEGPWIAVNVTWTLLREENNSVDPKKREPEWCREGGRGSDQDTRRDGDWTKLTERNHQPSV